MNTITLYRTRDGALRGQPLTWSVPGGWNELSRRQLLGLTGLLFQKLPAAEHSLRVLLVLLDPKASYRRARMLQAMRAERLDELVPLVKWVYQDRHLTRQLLPTLRVPGRPWRQWLGPGDRLKHLTFGEFIEADAHFVAYAQTNNPKYISLLIATLYRPAGRAKVGDRRRPFNSDEVADRARRAERLPQSVGTAIYLYYHGSRSAITKKFPKVFKQHAHTPNHEQGTREGWLGVLDSVAGGIFGDFEKTLQAKAVFVLYHLDRRVRQQEEMQKNVKRRGKR